MKTDPWIKQNSLIFITAAFEKFEKKVGGILKMQLKCKGCKVFKKLAKLVIIFNFLHFKKSKKYKIK